MKRSSRALVTCGVLLGPALACTGPASAATKAQVKAKALAIVDMPAGWSVDHTPAASSGCVAPPLTGKRDVRVIVKYADGQAPVVTELVETGPSAVSTFGSMEKRAAKCSTFETSAGGQTIRATVAPMSFPKVGNGSNASSITLTDQGTNLGIDLVVFRVGSYFGMLSLGALGTPDIGLLKSFVNAAVAKIQGRPITPVPS